MTLRIIVLKHAEDDFILGTYGMVWFGLLWFGLVWGGGDGLGDWVGLGCCGWWDGWMLWK